MPDADMKSDKTKKDCSERLQKNAAHQWEPERLNDGRTRLYLVRHGELVTSKDWRYVGHMDVELNEAGIAQITTLAGKLKKRKIDVILTSDLKRALKSAQIIGRQLDIKPIPYKNFREINIGQWEGMTMREIAEGFREEFEERSSNIAAYRIKGGESFQDVQKRVLKQLKTCLGENSGKNILLVAHGGVNRVILCHALGLDLNNLVKIDQSYACLNIIDYFDNEPVIRLINETTTVQ